MYRFVLLLLVMSFSLFGNSRTDVLDAFELTDPWDFNIEVNYTYNYRSSKIKREYFCTAGDANCNYDKMNSNGIVNANNFKFTNQEHIITPKLRFGLYKNVELSFALPIYISSVNKLGFDDVARRSASEDKAGRLIANPTHNGAGNTFWNLDRTGGQDLLFAHKFAKNYSFNTKQVPQLDENGNPVVDGSGNTVYVDGRYTNPDENFDSLDFKRSGLKTLNIDLKWGILDNDTDSSDPSWVLGVQYRVPVTSSASYYEEKKLNQIGNRAEPIESGTAPYSGSDVRRMLTQKIDLTSATMGDGVHWLKFETAVSKRYGFVAPVFHFWYDKAFVFGNSIFEEHSNREYYKPGDRFGFTLATDFVPWERFTRDPNTDAKNILASFSVSLGGSFFYQKKGMELSDLSDFIALPTVVDSYSNLSMFIELNFMPTKYVRLIGGFSAGYTTDHLLTGQARGIDHNKNGEIDSDELDPMAKNDEVLFNSINTIGSRIIATETLNLSGYFNLAVQF